MNENTATAIVVTVLILAIFIYNLVDRILDHYECDSYPDPEPPAWQMTTTNSDPLDKTKEP